MAELIDTKSDGYVLTCESPCDLGSAYLRQLRVPFACFHFYVNGQEHVDDCYESMSPEQFYAHMEAGDKISTSQVSPGEYRELWDPYLSRGLDVVHVTTSSGISGTYNSAVLASQEAMADNPGRKVYVVDSNMVSAGYGLLVATLADKRDEGLSVDELHDWAEANKFKQHFWFYAGQLKYLVAGGRVSKTSGFVGKLLKICPVLYWDQAGHPIHFSNVRTARKANRAMVDRMELEAVGGLDYAGECFISHSVAPELAADLAACIEERFPNLSGPVRVLNVGPTIGDYTGPTSLSIAFWSNEDKWREGEERR